MRTLFLISKVILVSLLLLNTSCSSDEDITGGEEPKVVILKPSAGEDQVVEKGETVKLIGKEEGNSTTYKIEWSFKERPSNSQAILANKTTLEPSFVADVAGNYTLVLKTFVGDQSSEDAVIVKVNEEVANLKAKVIFVNAIEGSENLIVSANGKDINTDAIAPFKHSKAYKEISFKENQEFMFTMGSVSTKEKLALEAEKNYTIVVTGTKETPEVIVHENRWNETTIDATTADDGKRKNDAINAIHAAPGLGKVDFHLAHPQGEFTFNFIIKFRNADEEIVTLGYKESDDALIGHNNTAFETTNWVQASSETTTDSSKALSDSLKVTPFGDGKDTAGWFISMIIVKDSNASKGYRILYINNTKL